MTTTQRWTVAKLADLPDTDEGTRYELIAGELYVSTQPSLAHQYTCTRVSHTLTDWCERSGRGVTFGAPGIIFSDEDAVAPDVVWLSHKRFRAARGDDGKLHLAPELVVEVLSPGLSNQHRDRVAKLALYGRSGVEEYWLIDPLAQRVERYQQQNSGGLHLAATLGPDDRLETPLLPGFSVPVASLFFHDPQ